MKRILYSLFISTLLVTSGLGQVLNGDFERWTSGKPDEWALGDGTGTYVQSLDSSNGSTRVTYHDSHSGLGTFITHILSNRTFAHPYGSNIPKGRRVLTIHYSHDCKPENGYVIVGYILYDQSGTVYYAGSQILSPSDWRSAQLVLPEPNTAVDTDFVEIDLKYTFASQSKNTTFNYSVSLDDVSLDSALDASVVAQGNSSVAPISVYPNPTAALTRIQIPNLGAGTRNLELRDVTGRSMLPVAAFRMTTPHSVEFDASSLANGLYFLRITSDAPPVCATVIVQH